jgi:sugar phosphate isomerase/epimerase
LPLEVLAQKAASWGYDGLELACRGDHFDVEKVIKQALFGILQDEAEVERIFLIIKTAG